MPPCPPLPRAIGAAFVLVLAGCYSGLGRNPAGGDGGDDAAADGTAASADDGTATGADTSDPGSADELPGPNTRLFRLTHAQWENTVRDLFRRDAPLGLADAFRVDAKSGPYEFDNPATTLEVDGPLWAQYQAAAVAAAATITADADALAAILPEDAGDESARARAFVIAFGRRAFRRPLGDDEIEAHVAIYDAGRDLYDDSSGFAAGIRAVIEAMLQSPWFLYRFESADEPDGEVIPLGPHELAARLSYLVWDSMPDDALFAAADDGSITDPDVLAEHARRMLGDARAQGVVRRFHEVVFRTQRFENISPNPAFYPDAPDELPALALEEFRRFVDHVIWTRGGGVAELLTSNETFVDPALAAIYGVDAAASDGFAAVELDPDTRRGVLTQIGFLAANATPTDPDPIHRGKFVATRIACKALPAPPDQIPPIPAPAEGETNRQTIEALTEAPGSVYQDCHASAINPYGWPFEGYDALGRHRSDDRGFPIDATATLTLDGEAIAIDGALAMADALADSDEVHACYARYWVSYAAGRWATDEELPLVERLGVASHDDQLAVVDMIAALVGSRPFRTRSLEELDP